MDILLENVYKTIKNQEVLYNIDFHFENGKRYGIIGRNGCGKTMLLRAICGFLRIDKGTITQNGCQIGSLQQSFIKDAGILVGETQFANHLSGFENLKLLSQIHNKISDEEICNMLEMVGLLDAKDKKYRKYSVGMKQRLRIAQAIMESPDIVILDEPFNGLDKDGVKEIKSLIDEFVDSQKLLILTSHNHQDILDLCDIIIEMDDGKVIDVTENERYKV